MIMGNEISPSKNHSAALKGEEKPDITTTAVAIHKVTKGEKKKKGLGSDGVPQNGDRVKLVFNSRSLCHADGGPFFSHTIFDVKSEGSFEDVVLSCIAKQLEVNEQSEFNIVYTMELLDHLKIRKDIPENQPQIRMYIELTELHPSEERCKREYLKLYEDVAVFNTDQQSLKNSTSTLYLGSPAFFLHHYLTPKKSDEGEPTAQPKTLPKIKLIITSINMTNNLPVAAAVAVEKTFFNTRFGLVHTAIQIGPFWLDWNKSNIVCPGSVESSDAIVAIDLKEVSKEAMIEYLKKAADLCTHWNRTEKYSSTNANCQHFCEALLKALDINMNSLYTPSIKRFLDTLRVTGKAEKRIGDTVFTTHKEVDKFKIEHGKELNENDELLLKAFDRAFWCKHLRDAYDEDSKPIDPECPFGHPKINGTFG